MDAKYLEKNVNTALTEALTSMVIATPDDKIEYLGRYLIQYVNRNKVNEEKSLDVKRIDDSLTKFELENESQKHFHKQEEERIAEENSRLPEFKLQLEGSTGNKTEVMQLLTSFISTFLNVPACYVAMKKKIGKYLCKS
jgi:hypothetical protein